MFSRGELAADSSACSLAGHEQSLAGYYSVWFRRFLRITPEQSTKTHQIAPTELMGGVSWIVFYGPADPQYRNESSSFKRPCVATEENLPAGSAKLSGDNSASIASRRWEKSLPRARSGRRPNYQRRFSCAAACFRFACSAAEWGPRCRARCELRQG